MIPHWDVYPAENVTLISPDDTQVKARFLFRDTVHACFQLLGRKDEVRCIWFKLAEDGRLRDAMERRWFVQGQRENTRHQAIERQEAKCSHKLTIIARAV